MKRRDKLDQELPQKGGGENVKTEHFCVAGSLGQPIPRRHRAGETSKATHENIKYTIFKQFHCKLSLRSSFSQLKVFLGAYWYAGGRGGCSIYHIHNKMGQI